MLLGILMSLCDIEIGLNTNTCNKTNAIMEKRIDDYK